jgi:hypothetical protein
MQKFHDHAHYFIALRMTLETLGSPPPSLWSGHVTINVFHCVHKAKYHVQSNLDILKPSSYPTQQSHLKRKFVPSLCIQFVMEWNKYSTPFTS